MFSANRTRLSAVEILDALAHENLIELRNYGERWSIIHRSGPNGACEEINSKDIDTLISEWANRCEQARPSSGNVAKPLSPLGAVLKEWSEHRRSHSNQQGGANAQGIE